eukprot:8859539-Pyramimonas_sp.AAC.1
MTFACPEANNIAKAYGDFVTQKPMSTRSRQQRNIGPRGRKIAMNAVYTFLGLWTIWKCMRFGSKHGLRLFALFM